MKILFIALLIVIFQSKSLSQSLTHIKRGTSYLCNLEIDTSKPYRWVLVNNSNVKIISRHIEYNPNKYLVPAAWEAFIIDPKVRGYTVLDFYLLPYTQKMRVEIPTDLEHYKHERRYVVFE